MLKITRVWNGSHGCEYMYNTHTCLVMGEESIVSQIVVYTPHAVRKNGIF